jgi:hypothetical protein
VAPRFQPVNPRRLQTTAPKTVNNVLTVLGVKLTTAVKWGALERIACAIKMLPTTKAHVAFHDFSVFGRLVEAARN